MPTVAELTDWTCHVCNRRYSNVTPKRNIWLPLKHFADFCPRCYLLVFGAGPLPAVIAAGAPSKLTPSTSPPAREALGRALPRVRLTAPARLANAGRRAPTQPSGKPALPRVRLRA